MWHCCSRLRRVPVPVLSRVVVMHRAVQTLDVAAPSPANTRGCSDQALHLLRSRLQGQAGVYFLLCFCILKQNQQSLRDGFFSWLEGAGFYGSEMLFPT